MDYESFDRERRRMAAWLAEGVADPEAATAAVARLRGVAGSLPAAAEREKALRFVHAMERLVAEFSGPRHDTLLEADEIMRAAHRAEGEPAVRRARAREAIEQIARLAAATPTAAERGAILDLNESLVELVAVLDRELAATGPDETTRPDP